VKQAWSVQRCSLCCEPPPDGDGRFRNRTGPEEEGLVKKLGLGVYLTSEGELVTTAITLPPCLVLDKSSLDHQIF
jgi:hypothetical protein